MVIVEMTIIVTDAIEMPLKFCTTIIAERSIDSGDGMEELGRFSTARNSSLGCEELARAYVHTPSAELVQGHQSSAYSGESLDTPPPQSRGGINEPHNGGLQTPREGTTCALLSRHPSFVPSLPRKNVLLTMIEFVLQDIITVLICRSIN